MRPQLGGGSVSGSRVNQELFGDVFPVEVNPSQAGAIIVTIIPKEGSIIYF